VKQLGLFTEMTANGPALLDLCAPSCDAGFSPCRRYRYWLSRFWKETPAGEHKHFLAVIGMNPSTADERENDPTITRCINFAKDWGFDGLVMLNLFAYRSTDASVLDAMVKRGEDPVGPQNDEWIDRLTKSAGKVVCAWGRFALAPARGAKVIARLKTMGVTPHALDINQDGSPKHPLFVRKDAITNPYVRHSDPDPSQVAAERIIATGQATRDVDVILAVLAHEKTLTAYEIARRAGWVKGKAADNVRVSRRMAQLVKDGEVVVTGLRRSWNLGDEEPITSYASASRCCGNCANWQRAPMLDKIGWETRVCTKCDAVLGIGKQTI
jgi:hypothetical protein